MSNNEEKEIVIVGGGICGLATALALHRKGIRSLVLEKSECLRAFGATLTIRTNGWHALDHLGIGSKLRQTAFPLNLFRERWVDNGRQRESQLSKGEVRCIKRSDLIETLASDLPNDTIRFGCQVISIELDPLTSYPTIQLQNGCFIKAMVLIGCDGVNSVVADFLGLNLAKLSRNSAARGFTNYPDGHGLAYDFTNFYKDHTLIGRVPVTDKLVYWFITKPWNSEERMISKNQELIKHSSLEAAQDFPLEVIEMIKHSDLNSLSLAGFRYHAPWDILFRNFRKGTVTVAGDALHAMGPYIGQGGAASLEDAIVLARCLAQKISMSEPKMMVNVESVGEAFDKYLKERRMRLLKLTIQSYLLGKLIESSSFIRKFIIIMLLIFLFKDRIGHTQYDCGSL